VSRRRCAVAPVGEGFTPNITVMIPAELGRQVRRVYERFAPIRPGLTLRQIVTEAAGRGLTLFVNELLSEAERLAVPDHVEADRGA